MTEHENAKPKECLKIVLMVNFCPSALKYMLMMNASLPRTAVPRAFLLMYFYL